MLVALTVYQLFAVLLDALAYRVCRLRPTPLKLFVAIVVGGLALLVGAVLATPLAPIGPSMFVVLGLTASGLFVHGPLVLFGGWWLLRRDSPRWARVPLVAGIVLVVTAIDAFLVEPTWLEVTRHTIVSDELTRPIRVAVVADFQTDHLGAYERRVIRRLAAEAPDLILFPGDYIHEFDDERHRALRSELNALLVEAGLAPRFGIHAVRGNTERPGWETIFRGLDAETYDATRTVERGELAITGLSFHDTFDAACRVTDEPGFHIVVGHAPDFALGSIDADLLVAGHTHGGQVRLPWLGPVITLSQVPRAWAAGRTELAGGRTLVVSRGVGLERGGAPRLRFLCRPELTILELAPRD